MDKKSRELVMAKLYFKNKDYRMAEKSFNEYLNINPEDVAALKLLAQVYEQNKRYDKAFEMYERCYLAEPDRTGVLLDICRILLMNEVWLENVDYRKWLNLAIRAFPSNPIVANFKTFLATLPNDEQSSPRRELPVSTNNKSTMDDPLEKILDKLTKMERRLETIEGKIANLSLNETNNRPSDLDKNKLESMMKDLQSSMAKVCSESFQQAITPKKVESNDAVPKTVTPVSNQASQPVTLSSLAQPQTQILTPPQVPAPTSMPTTTNPTLSLFKSSLTPSQKEVTPAQTIFKPSPQTQNQPTTTPAPSLFSSISQFSNQTPSGSTQASQSFGSNSSPFSFQISDKGTTQPAQPFGASASPFNFSSGNLFADSMRKQNIPDQGGSWVSNSTFSFSAQPKEEEKDDREEDGDNDRVENEELPIANTCDMQPIEIKTGEEDEDLLFEQRCKLYRFKDREYKERGIGSIKVLKHKTNGKGRLIMRREAIGLVCLNCWDCAKVERVRDTQVRWIGVDASDGDPTMTVFLAKFKTSELTDTFLSHLTSLFSDDPKPSTKEGSEVELVDPKLDQSLVDKARKLQLPDLFFHDIKHQDPCKGCNDCKNEE